MTDGLANQGVTDHEALFAIGRAHNERGIRTTTLGFGANFNEDLLTKLAEESGGNFYYIDSPEKAPVAFLEELGELSTVLGQNLEVILRCEDGVSVVTSYTPAAKASSHELTWRLNDLYADDVRLLLVSLKVPAGFAESGRSPIAQIGVRYQQVRDGTGERRHELPANLVFAEDALATDPHPEVLRERLVMSATRAKERAIRLADHGRHAAAQAELRQCTFTIRAEMAATDFDEADMSLLAASAEQCEGLESGFSAEDYGSSLSRKLALTQNYQANKQRGIYRK
jgi:Ca-activated chloride channel family protein